MVSAKPGGFTASASVARDHLGTPLVSDSKGTLPGLVASDYVARCGGNHQRLVHRWVHGFHGAHRADGRRGQLGATPPGQGRGRAGRGGRAEAFAIGPARREQERPAGAGGRARSWLRPRLPRKLAGLLLGRPSAGREAHGSRVPRTDGQHSLADEDDRGGRYHAWPNIPQDPRGTKWMLPWLGKATACEGFAAAPCCPSECCGVMTA